MDFAKLLAKIDSIESTKQLNESGAKPDFLDLDKDGNRTEPMKQAAKDAEAKKSDDKDEDEDKKLDEVSAPGQEEWIKKNKKRFIDQYGKKKGMEVLYATAWKRSKKVDEARQLEECYGQAMQGMDGQMNDRSGMSISSSMDTRTGTKTLSVSAEGQAADQLAQLLKLSGMMTTAGDMSSKDVELEEYANEPNPEVQGIETQLQQGNDLNRPKKMTPHGYQNGDNPLAMDVREQEELSALTQSLSEELEGIKVDKSKVPAYKRKQQGGDWKTTEKDLERERERNISGPEGLAALKKKQGMAEAIPYALSAANANAEFERTKTFVPRGYKGRVDTEVSGKEEYRSVMNVLKKFAQSEDQHVEFGLSGNKMSIFSKTMDSAALSDFLDMALQDFDQGVAEGFENTPSMIARLFSDNKQLFDMATQGNITPQLKKLVSVWGASSPWGENTDTRDPEWIDGTIQHLLQNYYPSWKSKQGVAEAMPMTSLTSRYVDDPKNPAFATKQPTGKDPLDSLPGIVALRKTDPFRAFRALQDYGFRNPNDPIIDGASKAGSAVKKQMLQKMGITDPRPWDVPKEVVQAMHDEMFNYIAKNLPTQQGVAAGSSDRTDEAIFPDSPIGDKLRQLKRGLTSNKPVAAAGAIAAPAVGALGATVAGSSDTALPYVSGDLGVGVAGSLWLPIAGTAALGALATVAGGYLSYKALNWLARKVFGTTEEAIEFAQSHVAAAKAKQPSFMFQGKKYPVKISSPEQAGQLEYKISQLQQDLQSRTDSTKFESKRGVAEGIKSSTKK